MSLPRFGSEIRKGRALKKRSGYPGRFFSRVLFFFPVPYGNFRMANDLVAELVPLFEFGYDDSFSSGNLCHCFVKIWIQRFSNRFERHYANRFQSPNHTGECRLHALI